MNPYAIVSLIALVLSLIVGITVFSLAPRRILGRAFFSGMLFLLVVEFSLLMIFLQKNSSKLVFWGKVATSSFCFLPPTWALISLVYARSNYRELLKKRIWYLSLLYGIGLVFFLLVWKVEFFSVPRSFPKDIFLITNFGKYFLIFALLITVVILINFENTLRLTRISSRKGKRVPLYVLTGAFLFWIYAISQILMFSRISSQLALAGFLVIIFTNLVLLFYSIKYGLTALEVHIGREVVYSSAMIFIVGVYLLVIGIVGKIVQVAGGSVNLFLSFLAAFLVFCILLATLVSKSLKERIKLFVDRNFYKNRYDYREQWGRFSESLSAVVTLDELLSTIIENITRIFSIHQAAIFLNDEPSGNFILAKTKNISTVHELKFSQKSDFIDWFYRLAEAVDVSTLLKQSEQIGLNKQEKQILKELQAVVCVPMITQRKFVGIITLGEKITRENYSKEDFELLETLANQSSVAILNARLHEDLMVSRELESFHKLSSFVLHDLRNSVSMLSLIVKNAEANLNNLEFQKDMLATISTAVGKMKALMSKISSVPGKLELRLQKTQVNDLITKVLKDARITELPNIQIEQDFQTLPGLTIDPELFEKVIENLVINALEALPQGGRVKVSTKLCAQPSLPGPECNSENGFAEIEISDTGMGMSEEFIRHRLFKPFQTTKKKGLGIGLYQCKEIVTAHGGTIEVQSKVGEGTRFKIVLPISNKYESVDHIKPLASEMMPSLN